MRQSSFLQKVADDDDDDDVDDDGEESRVVKISKCLSVVALLVIKGCRNINMSNIASGFAGVGFFDSRSLGFFYIDFGDDVTAATSAFFD